MRTCVGCRERAARADLLRVVVVEGRLVPDPRRRLPGRGASVHPDLRCLELAEKRRAFVRALRLPGPPDLDDVRRALQDGGAPHHRTDVSPTSESRSRSRMSAR